MDILMQFLIEALVLCLFGGVIGVSFAIEKINKIEEESFFEISQLEVSPNEKVEMTIYEEQIKIAKAFSKIGKESMSQEIIKISLTNKFDFLSRENFKIFACFL